MKQPWQFPCGEWGSCYPIKWKCFREFQSLTLLKHQNISRKKSLSPSMDF
nr:MAG TPA: hypothetical protein [Caudoviricetes sp.]